MIHPSRKSFLDKFIFMYIWWWPVPCSCPHNIKVCQPKYVGMLPPSAVRQSVMCSWRSRLCSKLGSPQASFTFYETCPLDLQRLGMSRQRKTGGRERVWWNDFNLDLETGFPALKCIGSSQYPNKESCFNKMEGITILLVPDCEQFNGHNPFYPMLTIVSLVLFQNGRQPALALSSVTCPCFIPVVHNSWILFLCSWTHTEECFDLLLLKEAKKILGRLRPMPYSVK